MQLIKNLILYGDFMKNVIYSFYIDIDPKSDKHINTKNKLKKYYDNLLQSKIEYAKHCNAEFILFGDDENYENFKNEYNMYEFDMLNFYKHKLYETLLKKYENILYFDFDVIPNTTISMFDHFDMNYINVHSINSTKYNVWTNSALNRSRKGDDFDVIMKENFDKYSMYIKALAKQSMLMIDNIYNFSYEVVNTGIICGNSKILEKIQLTTNLKQMIDTLLEAKTESYFGKSVNEHYEPNNETFFTYLLEKNNLKWNNLPKLWHDIISKDDKPTDSYMLHMINKKFEDFYV